MSAPVLAVIRHGTGFVMAQKGGRKIVHVVPREISDALIEREAAVAELIEALRKIAKRVEYDGSEDAVSEVEAIAIAALARVGAA